MARRSNNRTSDVFISNPRVARTLLPGFDSFLSASRVTPIGPRYGGNRGFRVFTPPVVSRPPGGRFVTFRDLSPVLAFRSPKRSIICVRRSQRREVLFALHRTGRGSRSSRRRTQDSSYRC